MEAVWCAPRLARLQSSLGTYHSTRRSKNAWLVMSEARSAESNGAERGTRTPTVLLPPAPQAGKNTVLTRSAAHPADVSGALNCSAPATTFFAHIRTQPTIRLPLTLCGFLPLARLGAAASS